jgi:hypothetical protein
VNLIRGNFIIFFAILVFAVMAVFSVPCRAQEVISGGFNLSREVRWQNSVLPMGDYVYFIDPNHSPVMVRVEQKGGRFSGVFIPQAFLRPGKQVNSGIFTAHIGDDAYVIAFQLQELGGELEFSIPDAEADKEAPNQIHVPESSPSSVLAHGYLTIVNPNHEKISLEEAEKVYLKVCEVIEREFHRPAPIRPRLVLRLGASNNVLRYPMGEIQLKKWDQYRFADGVLELAVHAMLPPEERTRLSNTAVSQAGSTVNVCELKACVN